VTTGEALKALRGALGDTQQALATRVGLSISSIVRYEATRVPDTEIALRFAEIALSAGRPDLQAVFLAAVEARFELPAHLKQKIEGGRMSKLLKFALWSDGSGHIIRLTEDATAGDYVNVESAEIGHEVNGAIVRLRLTNLKTADGAKDREPTSIQFTNPIISS